jgi:hypothetical protein
MPSVRLLVALGFRNAPPGARAPVDGSLATFVFLRALRLRLAAILAAPAPARVVLPETTQDLCYQPHDFLPVSMARTSMPRTNARWASLREPGTERCRP